MASRPVSAAGVRGTSSAEKTYFEQQREELIGEIAMSFEHVLANINKLNRSLEAVIAVGNEFSSVEALWSTFENVMAKEEPEPPAAEEAPSSAAGSDERVVGDNGKSSSDGGLGQEEEEQPEGRDREVEEEEGDSTIRR
ncbi:DASH complex subunit Dad1-domain-containing protein [Rhypophila decipiens]|uniref:DASH complex subunit DAD1 n=1 Tax=Rhypophila decipiens TaxID=261697 RepID=A0AAN6YAU4_9PEZI|nr:DASH complex subunit Dad1-domain-containing protein [Rhypophila decipiens]